MGTACQLCGASAPEEVQLQADFRILTEGREVPFDIRTVLCGSCGLVYTDPQPAPELLARFYAAQERDAFVEGEDASRIPGEGSRQDQARWIEAALGSLKGRRVLEIGCYDGYLLHLLEARGARGLGIEPSARAAQLGADRFGVEIRAGAFETLELSLQSFDLIVLSHVLEHLSQPRAVLERCRKLLGPEGSLFIEVPNVLKPRAESAVNFFTFDHLFNFSPETLAALLRSCGFEPGALADDFGFPAFRMMGLAADPQRVEAAPDCVVRTRQAIGAFVHDRAGFVERLRARIASELQAWCAAGSRVAIYGAGYHTECLLDATDLRRAELVALVDGNPAKQGTRVLGLPVVSPRELGALAPDVVVISSYDFQDEMVESLRRVGLGEVPIVTFYSDAVAFSNADAVVFRNGDAVASSNVDSVALSNGAGR